MNNSKWEKRSGLDLFWRSWARLFMVDEKRSKKIYGFHSTGKITQVNETLYSTILSAFFFLLLSCSVRLGIHSARPNICLRRFYTICCLNVFFSFFKWCEKSEILTMFFPILFHKQTMYQKEWKYARSPNYWKWEVNPAKYTFSASLWTRRRA